ncbi:hypothetical protein B0H14DRAFT_3129116 [Mycena olivaceomarginata]|nr:hypothetical protein B0H14DRAFT_3129116 [Mycena olivaceomarginata]
MDEYHDYPYKQQFQPWFDPGLGHHRSTSPRLRRMTLAGNLDPATGIFYRAPEHPRLRTAQACDKCRARKAKCSGEHPSCARCLARGLPCAYAKEGRVRGPNKTKSRSGSVASASSHISHSLQSHSADDLQRLQGLVNVNVKKARRNTTLGTSLLEPLSSCEPLVLPPKHPNHNGLHADRYGGQRQQEQHLLPLPTSASKRLSLPARSPSAPRAWAPVCTRPLAAVLRASAVWIWLSVHRQQLAPRELRPALRARAASAPHQHQQTKGYEHTQTKGAPGYDGNATTPTRATTAASGSTGAPHDRPSAGRPRPRAPFPLDAGPRALAHNGHAAGVGRPAISLDMDLGRGRSMSSGSEGDESAVLRVPNPTATRAASLVGRVGWGAGHAARWKGLLPAQTLAEFFRERREETPPGCSRRGRGRGRERRGACRFHAFPALRDGRGRLTCRLGVVFSVGFLGLLSIREVRRGRTDPQAPSRAPSRSSAGRGGGQPYSPHPHSPYSPSLTPTRRAQTKHVLPAPATVRFPPAQARWPRTRSTHAPVALGIGDGVRAVAPRLRVFFRAFAGVGLRALAFAGLARRLGVEPPLARAWAEYRAACRVRGAGQHEHEQNGVGADVDVGAGGGFALVTPAPQYAFDARALDASVNASSMRLQQGGLADGMSCKQEEEEGEGLAGMEMEVDAAADAIVWGWGRLNGRGGDGAGLHDLYGLPPSPSRAAPSGLQASPFLPTVDHGRSHLGRHANVFAAHPTLARADEDADGLGAGAGEVGLPALGTYSRLRATATRGKGAGTRRGACPRRRRCPPLSSEESIASLLDDAVGGPPGLGLVRTLSEDGVGGAGARG